MLREALRLIATGGASSSEELAAKLEVEPSMARQLIENLVQLGYLSSSQATKCESKCSNCPLSSGCFGLTQFWSLTEKGQRAAARD